MDAITTLATFQRRLAGLVGLALGDVGNLGSDLEYDLLDAASGRQITTGCAQRRQLIHASDAQVLYEKILDAAVATMRSDFASMQMFHPERGELWLLWV